MGFFKKATTSYPAKRNRINQQQHPATVNPLPSSNNNYAQSVPAQASVYQANSAPVAATTTTAAAAIPAATTYGAFPGNNAPVKATLYVPGQGQGQGQGTPANAVPVTATAYVPSGSNTTTAAVLPSAPPPSTNPMYSNNNSSFNNGNGNYKSEESSFWECSVCTFPNLRTESNCKGCGSNIPPGMLHSAASAQQQIAAASAAAQYQPQRIPQDTYNPNVMTDMSAQMNNLSMGGVKTGAGSSSGVMRVHIPNGMSSGQKIKVRSPDGKEVVKAIPPQSEWHYDGTKPFFRMQFGVDASPSSAVVAGHTVASNNTATAHEVPPPHSVNWRHFYCTAPSHHDPTPIGTSSVPSTPRGAAGYGIPPNGRHKALIVGINYHRTRAELRGCINDAKNMQDMLRRNGFPYDGSHMLLLTDEKARGKEYQPTVQNLTKAFAWLMTDVRKGDILFFHYSGHGGQVPDKTGHEADGMNETIVPVDYDRKGQITDDVLWGSLVYKLPQGARLIALMDMCHSGTGLDLPFDYNVDRKMWTEDINPAHSQGDVVLFSGCEDAQTSADVGGGYGKMAGGAMTIAFMKAYEQTAAMSTYHDFLTAVKKQLRKKRFSQRPQLTSSQQFDAKSRLFTIGYQSSSGGIPSVIEANHNPKIGRTKRRHVRPARQGFGGRNGGGGNDLFNLFAGAAGAALVADALF